MSTCLDCGEEQDDYSPCACALSRPPGRAGRPPAEGQHARTASKTAAARVIAAGGMRAMVARKLEKQRAT